MKVVSLGALHRHPIEHFGSERAGVAPVSRGEAVSVTVIELGPGGRLGAHPAVGDQLFVVLAGAADVRGGSGEREHVTAGTAVVWADGEEHETTTELGLTALVVECAGLYAGV